MSLIKGSIGIPGGVSVMGKQSAIPLLYARGQKGDEGLKGWPLQITWLNNVLGTQPYSFSFKRLMRDVGLDLVASVYIDNSNFDCPLYLQFNNGVYQTIQAAPRSQGYYPVTTINEVLDFTISIPPLPFFPNNNITAQIVFLNKEMLPVQWASVPAGAYTPGQQFAMNTSTTAGFLQPGAFTNCAQYVTGLLFVAANATITAGAILTNVNDRNGAVSHTIGGAQPAGASFVLPITFNPPLQAAINSNSQQSQINLTNFAFSAGVVTASLFGFYEAMF